MQRVSSVIIIGAGLGGLACAIECRRQGLNVLLLLYQMQVHIVVGAGIQIPPNGSRILQRFGLLPKISDRATVVERIDVRRYEDGQMLCSKEQTLSSIENYGAPWFVIHRQDYHGILLEEATRLGAAIRLGASVKNILTDRDTVVLEDGTELTANAIIGADGIWSVTREILLERSAPPIETGDLAYRATFTRADLEALKDSRVDELCAQNSVTLWMGPNKHVVFYPLRNGAEFNMVLLRPDDLPEGVKTAHGELGEMRATFEGWDPVLLKLISCIPSVLKWKLLHHEELQTWTKKHVALLGDACHPTLPYQAQGAAMAVEDGAVLGVLLGKLKSAPDSTGARLHSSGDSTDSVTSMLKIYEDQRKQRTTLNVQGALRNRWFYHMVDGEEQQNRDRFLRAVTDWEAVKSPYTWADAQYNRDLLGYDSIAPAEHAFDSWFLENS
ncbi:FAD/NAD(P)-binding domain-containing protein [Aaosphaeria arxii CBS 175.79]|uniref:FAD/NAD(P)-binding domain-containing protein n=1 Tax=Aaosphaeria arxii CBS 175.79 TaxID=1450172 RepID=A0A6A5XGP7_9PLEO|nr:FAD/NAD(P)-binding domain-containing protein [Aaosphaeria arxii CBS 175.79]KAF2011971.1 FAD/NAD(P)-binding domain-containing protein [Aaosphaeria arxii CBS 175.79]